MTSSMVAEEQGQKHTGVQYLVVFREAGVAMSNRGIAREAILNNFRPYVYSTLIRAESDSAW
jgi:hypothetical protein